MLKKQGFKHPQNKKGSGWLYLFENTRTAKTDNNYSRIYPDFYKPEECVLDAKYKKITDGKIAREDLYQLITYMHVMKISTGGIIYPLKESEHTTENNKTYALKGYGGTIHTFGLKVPSNPVSREEFAQRMRESEEKLLARIAEDYLI